MRFTVLCLALLTVAACVPTTPPGSVSDSQPVSIALYLIYEAPGEGIVERIVEKTGETLFLSPTPNLTQNDIAWAAFQIDKIKQRPYLLVHFSPVGTEKMATLTQQNIGKRIAIVIDGKILSTPLIQSEVRDGRITIQGFESAEEVQRLADALAR